MAYEDRLYVALCPTCKSKWLFSPKSQTANEAAVPKVFTCKSCGARNTISAKEHHPNLPPEIFLGHEKHNQRRIMPFPITQRDSEWAYPYSIRSVVYQFSRELGACNFTVAGSNRVFGSLVFRDVCFDEELGPWEEGRVCHLTSGFTRKEQSCHLFEGIKQLCQTDPEKRFLWAYLASARTKDFPMLLPQVRVGIAGRRRPDFIAFVPTQHLVYAKYAIELDGAHTEQHKESDAKRDSDLAAEGFNVISLRPGEKGYFEEVKTLLERFAEEMTEASKSPWDYATEIGVSQSIGGTVALTDDDIPF